MPEKKQKIANLHVRVSQEIARKVTECEFVRGHASQQATLEEALSVYFDWVEKNHGAIEIKRVTPSTAKITKAH